MQKSIGGEQGKPLEVDMSMISESWSSPRRLLAGASALALVAALGAGASNVWPSTAHADSAATTAALPAQVGPDFADLVARVRPAVVSIRVKLREPTTSFSFQGQTPFNDNPFQGTPFEKFFRQFQQGQGGGGGNAPQFAQAQGSGFFVSADGYIVTNNHVVKGATEVTVVTDGGKTLAAKVVGTDPKTDLALVKVEGGNFPFVPLATTTPRVGEWVIAMGNPFGLGGTVTAGIVSAEGRDIGEGPYDNFIQIDAPVNKGNSGGPTFNLKGEVVGVNTAIFSPSGTSAGVAFDIPAATVASIIPQLEANGRVDRGWLGLQIQPVTGGIADSLGLKSDKGALVAAPQDGGPALKAGIKSGDVITAVNGDEIADARTLSFKIASMKPGSVAKLTVIHNGKTETLDVTLGEMPGSKVQKASLDQQNTQKGKLGSLGIEVMPAASVEGSGDAGVVITKVDQAGKGADLGLAEGDVILKVGDKSVANAEELKAAITDNKSSGHKDALLLIKHGTDQHFVAVPIATS